MPEEKVTDDLIERMERTPTRLEDCSTEMLRLFVAFAALPDGTKTNVTVIDSQPSTLEVHTPDGLRKVPIAESEREFLIALLAVGDELRGTDDGDGRDAPDAALE
jgi:hypothetical protein